VADVVSLLAAFGVKTDAAALEALAAAQPKAAVAMGAHARKEAFLTHPTFNSWHSESQMLRYLAK